MKMISIDDIIEICDTNILPLKARGQGVAVAALRRVIDAAKEYAVDAESVKYAFWKFKEDRAIVDGKDWVCSDCRKAQRYKENYCPNCGARMDKEAE